MSRCDEVAALVADLRLGDTGALTQLDALRDPAPCLVEGLASAATTEDWLTFERYVLAASRYPSPAMTSVLCDVLGRRIEDLNNEDIIDVLAIIADPDAIDVLTTTIDWQPPWDEFHWIGVKCVLALANIGTQAALDVLRSASHEGAPEVRETAARMLQIDDR
jgi:hypothetical protein